MTLALVGWAGTLLVLAGYRLSIVRSRPPIFHRANVVGTVLLGASNAAVGAWPAVVLNLAFGLVALHALLRKDITP